MNTILHGCPSADIWQDNSLSTPYFKDGPGRLKTLDREAATAKRLKEARDTLEEELAARYSKLTEAEIKTLVVDDKWLARLADDVQGELDRVSQSLAGRIRQLADRYANPLPKLVREVETLAARVDAHLARMGFRP